MVAAAGHRDCDAGARGRVADAVVSDESSDGIALFAIEAEFVLEAGVGLTIYAATPKAWLSWEEAQKLVAWLVEATSSTENG
jgi:hypothetical protein